MKKSRKAILATTVFYAAVNFTGCVYGPPPEDMNYSGVLREYSASADEQVTEDEDNTSETEEV